MINHERVGLFFQFRKSIGTAIESILPWLDPDYGCKQQEYQPLAQLEPGPPFGQKEATAWAVIKSANPYTRMLSCPVSDCRSG